MHKHTAGHYIKDILQHGRNKKKQNILHLILVWEIYLHMASMFSNIWQNVVWGLKFTFVQSFFFFSISQTLTWFTQDGKNGFHLNYFKLQIIATRSSSKLLLKLCLIFYKQLCCYLFYMKEYWWKGSSYNGWHKSVFGSFIFFLITDTPEWIFKLPKVPRHKYLRLNITHQ